jgi:hypothetical protein
MLDFYIIPDEAAGARHPQGLVYAGSLELKLFGNLVKKGWIAPRYNYFSDFRWRSGQVQQLYAQLNSTVQADTDAEELRRLLAKAVEANSGLMAFGD